MIPRRRFFSQCGAAAAVSLISTGASRGAAGDKPGSQAKAAAPARFGDGRDWFLDRRFGMFAHWGLYSLLGWHEQHQWRGRIPRKGYVKLAERWNPVKFDPEQWLDLLEEAGMKYLTVTTKHHDGFCLFDSKLTKFTSVHTPYAKDIVGMLSDACHKRSIPLCLYYSIADWNHPNYPNQGRHHELPGPEDGDKPDWNAYLEFLKGQVRELCTNYGRIHGIWWDMNVPVHVDPSINAMIRKLQPDAVINDRGFDKGDFGTPERDYKADDARAFSTRVEACQAVGSESWGYREDEDFHTVGHLERSITRYLARGGNYLLNVGPRPDGDIDPRSTAILKDIGKWMSLVGEAFGDAVPASHLTSNSNVMLTRRGNVLYVHLQSVPVTDSVKLKPFTTAPKRALFLNNGSELPLSTVLCPADHESRTGYLRIRGIPADSLANTVGVVKLEFDDLAGAIAAAASPTGEGGVRSR
jgi:alpha-L-fucosidase